MIEETEFYNWRKLPLKQILAVVILAAAFYLGLVFYAEWDKLFEALKRLAWPTVLQIIALALLSYGLRFLRWWMLLKHLNVTLALMVNVLVYLGGFTLSMTPGKAGESIRAVMLAIFDVPIANTLACFVTERSLDLLVVACLTLLAMQLFPQSLLPYVFALIVVLLLVFAALYFMAQKPQWSSWLHERFQPFLQGLGHKLGLLSQSIVDFIKAWQQLLHWFVLLPAILLALASWGAQGLVLELIVANQGYEISWSLMVGIYCLSVLAGAISFIPGGIGATEGVMTGLLVALGLSWDDALICALLCRLSTLWLAILVGIISLCGFEYYLQCWQSLSS